MNRAVTPTRRGFAAIAAAVAGAGALAACSGSGDKDKNTITLGFIPSWTDGLSTAYLIKDQLEVNGFTVKLQKLTEIGALYTALSRGDVDLYPSAWSEVTHASYMAKYKDDIEDLGAYYSNAKLTWAVPSYSAIASIADIPSFKEQLSSKIIGIEPSAGLTEVSKNKVIPDYGLEDFELTTSSTQAMLTSLQSAIDKQEEIVVTLWRPFWANSAYDTKELEDPKGALGGTESLHFLGRKDFAQDFPEVATWVGGIKMDDSQYDSLEKTVVEDYGEGKYQEGVQAWIKDNPAFVFSGDGSGASGAPSGDASGSAEGTAGGGASGSAGETASAGAGASDAGTGEADTGSSSEATSGSSAEATAQAPNSSS